MNKDPRLDPPLERPLDTLSDACNAGDCGDCDYDAPGACQHDCHNVHGQALPMGLCYFCKLKSVWYGICQFCGWRS